MNFIFTDVSNTWKQDGMENICHLRGSQSFPSQYFFYAPGFPEKWRRKKFLHFLSENFYEFLFLFSDAKKAFLWRNPPKWRKKKLLESLIEINIQFLIVRKMHSVLYLFWKSFLYHHFFSFVFALFQVINKTQHKRVTNIFHGQKQGSLLPYVVNLISF